MLSGPVLIPNYESKTFSYCDILRGHSDESRAPFYSQQTTFPICQGRIEDHSPALSDDVRQRALAILNNQAINAEIRGVIRYGLEIDDPWTPDHVRRVRSRREFSIT
jgi:hypothetical protein